MRGFRFTALALLVFLAACAPLRNTYDTLTGAEVSAAAVVVAANTFNALEATATNYLLLKRCTGANGPVCRDPKVTAKVIPAVRAGRVARNNLEKFLREHPGELGKRGLYDSLVAATDTIREIFAQYKIGARP